MLYISFFVQNISYIIFQTLNSHVADNMVHRAGEGRGPWATTISPSVPHISFFLFRQPWTTTLYPSVPPHLTLPGKTTFFNGIFSAFKVWFLKIQPRQTQKSTTQTIFSILLKIDILCVEFLNCFTMKFLTNSMREGLWIIKILKNVL